MLFTLIHINADIKIGRGAKKDDFNKDSKKIEEPNKKYLLYEINFEFNTDIN